MAKREDAQRDPNDLAAFVVTGAAGTAIYGEGDAATGGFILQDGQVELLRETAGRPHRIATLGPGDVFGEGAFFHDQPREDSARAVTEFRALQIDRATFEQIAREDPSIALGLARRLADYIRDHRNAPPPEAKPVESAGRRRATASRPAVSTGSAVEPFLVAATGNLEFRLSGRDMTVGRIDRATGHSPDIDLTAADTERSLSRRHARLVLKSGRFYVREEPGVRNGTFVDGRRVPAGRDVELSDGAKVRFGLVETTFVHRPGATEVTS